MAFTDFSEFYYRQWRQEAKLLSPYNPVDDGFSLREEVSSLKSIRVAAVLDAFSALDFSYECNLLNLDGTGYIEELESFQPDLFLFESAWNGKDGGWRMDIRTPTPKIQEVVAWCHAHCIPVVFWNKEDPVHTNRFKRAAELADYVFTTDADLIPKYKAWLGHDRVYLLHFAAQPATKNPIEVYERKNKTCYAGSWYFRRPWRNALLRNYIEMLKTRCGVEIYDRNLEIPDTNNKFPPEYSPYIQGCLSPEQIDIAYKGYLYGLNLNSVTDSSTMFARRVFELGASNTLILSNYAKGLQRCFGNLVICTDDMEEAAHQFDENYVGTNARRLRLLMLRKVLREHLYEDRLDRIISIVFGKHLRPSLPDVYVVDTGTDSTEHALVRRCFDAQTWSARHLILPDEIGNVPDDALLGIFSPRDHYGANYLTDLVLSLRYSDLEGFFKPETPESAYCPLESAALQRGIVRMSMLRDRGYVFHEDMIIKGKFLCIDEFNYQPGHAEDWTEELDDLLMDNQGLSVQEMESDIPYKPEWQQLAADDLSGIIAASDAENIHITRESQHLCISNDFEEGVAYVRLTRRMKKNTWSILNDGLEVCFHMETVRGPEAAGACFFISSGLTEEIGPAFLNANQACRVRIPPKCGGFRLAIRIEAGSTVQISGISLRKSIS